MQVRTWKSRLTGANTIPTDTPGRRIFPFGAVIDAGDQKIKESKRSQKLWPAAPVKVITSIAKARSDNREKLGFQGLGKCEPK